MACNFRKDFGDSIYNQQLDLELKTLSHVFDGEGENILCNINSDSAGLKISKTRIVNTAIYVESGHSVNSSADSSTAADEITPHPHYSYGSNSTSLINVPSSQRTKRKICLLDNEAIYDNTPHNLTYREEGGDTFRLSVASLSTNMTAKDEKEVERRKRDAFEEWCARKEREKLEKAKREKRKRDNVKKPTPEEREEAFQRWLKLKNQESERRKAEEIMRKEREKQSIEKELLRKEEEKSKRFAEWFKKKEKELKALKTKEERNAAREAIAQEYRKRNGERAYREWLKASKDKPLPVPLNQGLLSMRGTVSELYVNPNPWQPPI